jgi:energy-coupling factor transporter ATP-binding protein EcfA2
MSERLHRLTMRSFRGVPGELTIDFGEGRSIAVYGDNGTGKSTIADALEWYFTGEIELLSHEGRQHAVRNLGGASGGDTSVELVTSGTLGGKVVFPDERLPEALGLAARETFLLRGRTLADFINKSKTEKWKALAEILGLEAVEELRQDLQRVRTDLKKRVKTAAEKAKAGEVGLAPEGGPVSEEGILASVQAFCRSLGVDVPVSLERVTSPIWIASVSGEGAEKAAPRLDALVGSLGAPDVDSGVLRLWNAVATPEAGGDLDRLTLLKDGDALLTSSPSPAGHCPLCGQELDGAELAARVRTALAGLLDQSRALEEARAGMRSLCDRLNGATQDRRALFARAKGSGIELPEPPSVPEAITAAPDKRVPVDPAIVHELCASMTRWDDTLRGAVAAASSDASETADKRRGQLAMLAALADQIRDWRTALAEHERANKALAVAERVYEAYQKLQKDQLEEILQSISLRVAEIYQALHPGEDLGGITVEPWTAKGIELAVDFHGSRQRPPHGVLSESHLNSLAIALFLAMARTFNEKIRFLVLDDVINSFDVDHRGQLATMLAERFDDWQLIVLTHDHQFFEHLSRRAPSWKRLEITSWSYDDGPRTTKYDSGGLLGEARDRLGQGDVNGAATKARRSLEELLQEICERLSAELPFRRGTSNDRRELGELFKGVRRALKEHAKGMLTSLEPLLKNLEADVQATLNVEAHASRGKSGDREVEATLDRIGELDRTWSCPACGTRVWHKGTPESSRCKCGKSIFPPST